MPHSYDSPILLLFEGNFVPTEAVKIHIGNLADCRVHVCHRDNRRVISANFVWWTVWWNTVHMHQCLSVSRPLLSAVIKLNNRRLISIHSLGLLAMFAVSFFKGPFLPRVPISCFLSFFFFFCRAIVIDQTYVLANGFFLFRCVFVFRERLHIWSSHKG